jgi:ubiquinone/menaquinone biosynthesis C-methylase UbiE
MSDEEFHGQFAKDYDSLAEEYRSYGGMVIFGLVYDQISPGEKILDVGIGTGLSSERFHRIGTEIYGIDISEEMLEECRKKGFAQELKVLDITSEPIPYPDCFFNHVICHGVLHFFEDLAPIFEEISRVIRKGGVFVLTIMCDESGGPEGDVIEKKITKWNREAIYHGREYISKISKINHLTEIMSLQYVGGIDPEDGEIHFTRAHVMRKLE